MKSVTKDFVAKIAVGIRGIALMEISETLSPHSVYQGSDIFNDCIVDDISGCGIEEWAEYSFTSLPTEPGIYTLSGSVRFTEDDVEYFNTRITDEYIYPQPFMTANKKA